MAGRSDATGHPGWVCVGAFAGAHGVRGEVRLKSFTDEPAAIGRFKALHKGADGAPVRLTLVRPVKGAFVARVDGVSDRDAAEALKGVQLFVRRDALPEPDGEDEFYLADLIGLTVLAETGERLGQVRSVDNFGAGDLMELALDKPVEGLGRVAVVPFTRAVVPRVDLDGGSVTVRLAAWVAGQIDGRGEDE